MKSSIFLIIFCFLGNKVLAQDLLVRGGLVLDPAEGKWKRQDLLIEKGKIVSHDPKKITQKVSSLDLENHFIIPGLIDSHTHIFLEDPTNGHDFAQGLLKFYKTHTHSQRINLGKKRSLSLLKMGFSAIRDLGNDGGNDVLGVGRDGVRVFSSGPGYTPKLGQFPSGTPKEIIFKEYSSMDEYSLKLLKNHKFRTLKLYADEDPNPTITPLPLLKKWVERGKELGFRIAIHAILSSSIQNALDVKTDSLEHGTHLTEKQLKQMALQKTVWVPSTGPKILLDDRFKDIRPHHVSHELKLICSMIPIAHKLGVTMAFGSDYYYSLEKDFSFGEATMEALLYFHECGLPSIEVLRMATIHGAKLIGDNALGNLNPGSYADFVVYKDDPIKNLSVLKTPFKVFKNGAEIP